MTEKNNPKSSLINPESHACKSVLLLWSLIFLFFLRVLGQALQRWIPQPYLPPFNEFQGSSLPYQFLLPTQLLILALMVWCSWRIQHKKMIPRSRAGRTLAWIGGIYMLGSVCRIVIGFTWPEAPAWFSTWIPALFHVVLAGFVLSLSHYHLHFSQFLRRDS